MEWVLLFLALAGVLAAVLAVRRLCAMQQQMAQLSEQMEQFMLRFQQLPESLDEGVMANLHNQIARVEGYVLYQRRMSQERENQVTRFVENMAHQMKNALTALQIQLDLLSLHIRPDEQVALQKSQACMSRLTSEIDRVLKSSQLAAGKIRMDFEPLDLRQELILCLEHLRAITEARKVTVILEVPEHIVLSGDGFWLSQAFENVLKNAVEHTAERSVVTIRMIDEGRQICIRVEDEGKGIKPEELPDLFRRFHRGSVTKAGYGIGLSMARDIIDAHHGSLTAGNRRREGAWFEITLPVLNGSRSYVR